MKRTGLGLIAICLIGCASPSRDQGWLRHDIDISGRRISLSAPPGDIADKTVVSARLGGEEPLFKRAWIYSRNGAIDASLYLKTLRRPANGSFFEVHRAEVLEEVRRHFPLATVTHVAERRIGERMWTCYLVTTLDLYTCVLDIDGKSYLEWRALWVPNRERQVPAHAEQMMKKLEASIEVAF
jgi:hypothetical protein